jgi:IstB-like ATP binding protein
MTMVQHPTFDKLQALRLSGMSQALVEQMQTPEIAALSFEERLGLLVDRESTERENRRLTTACAGPNCAKPPASKLWTIGIRVDSISP